MSVLDFGNLSSHFDYVIFLMFLGFILGCLYPFLILSKIKKQHRFLDFIFKKREKIEKAYKISFNLSLLGVIICYIYLFWQVSPSTYINDPNYIKTEVDRSILATYLALFCYVAIPLGVFQYQLTRKRKYLIFPVLLSFLYGMSYWGRLAFFFGLISLGSSIVFVFYIFIEKNQRVNVFKSLFKILSRIFFIILVITLILTWSISFRLKSFDQSEYDPYKQKIENSILKTISPLFGSELAMRVTYAYIAAPIATLNYWVDRDSEYLLGQASFPYVYRTLKKVGLFDKEITVGDENIGDGLQLPTLPGYLYRDFGNFGVFLFMFISGFLIQFFYILAIRKENILTVLITISGMIYIVMGPMINTFCQTDYLLIIVYSIVFGKYISHNNDA